MRVLMAPDCFTGTLTAGQAAAAMAQGWHDHAPDDEVRQLPLSDGGPGFLDVAAAALGGTRLPVVVTGPLGRAVPAEVLLVDGVDGRTAIVESAQACGLHLVPLEERDPTRTTTAGVGDLLSAARGAGATRIVVGIGGTGTNDAGAGMLARLAADAVGEQPRWAGGGGSLAGTTAEDLAGLVGLARAWRGVDLVAAADVDVPLLGFHGASAAFAEQKGATPEQAQQLERCLGDFAAAAEAAGPGLAPSLLTPRPRLATAASAGAGGGLGYGLLLLGARAVSGADWAIETAGLREAAATVDLVLTGEGRFDWQSLRGKVVSGVGRACADLPTPVVVVAGQVDVGRREAQAAGIDGAYPLARGEADLAASLADPAATLRATVARLGRTWGPRAGGAGSAVDG